ncbi:MAG: NUDIX domain-containing protein, partial [Caldilineaceae bacterium]|nr:NUDIX domain-containing protein [Caldilineaceae bacterium]
KRYRAAGGVVVQQGLVDGLDAEQTYVLVLDRPTRGEVRLPKGHIEVGESDASAALRETAEEAGYADLRVLADLGHQQVAYDYKGYHYIREERYFLMQLASNTRQAQAEEDAAQFQVRWVTVDEALTE